MKKLINQILKFGVVGIIAFLIDYSILTLLTEIFNVYYLTSACISFTISVIFNYIASMKFVFKGKDTNKYKEFFVFVLLSIIGLLINQFGMKCMVEYIHIHYLISKVFITGVVMCYNFITRKLFIEKKENKIEHI